MERVLLRMITCDKRDVGVGIVEQGVRRIQNRYVREKYYSTNE